MYTVCNNVGVIGSKSSLCYLNLCYDSIYQKLFAVSGERKKMGRLSGALKSIKMEEIEYLNSKSMQQTRERVASTTVYA